MKSKNPAAAFLSGIIVFLFLFSVSAQETVNITGQVVDRNGTGVEGATVTLLGESMSTTTDSDGNYVISGGTGVIGTFGNSSSVAGAVLKNGKIMLNVQDNNTLVKIGLYNMTGRNILDFPQKRYSRGEYLVDLFNRSLASQVYFLRVRIGEASSVFKIPMFNNRPEALNLVSQNSGSSNRYLSKAVEYPLDTTLDSVIVQKDGYSRGTKPVDVFECERDFIVVDTAWFWGDRDAIPAANNVMTYLFLNRTGGEFTDDEVFWQEPGGGAWHSIAEQPYFDMGTGSSGRTQFSVGEPGGQYWDFEEHTITSTAWYGNTTRVDGWRLPFAIRLVCHDGFDEMLGEKYHIFFTDRDTVFQRFKDAVPDEFDACADNGYPYRIIAPGKGDGVFNTGEIYEDYMDSYLAELGITTATTKQVFACEGDPFGSNAQLAGAVNRHCAHLDETEWENPDNFYKTAPANFYAKFWHDNSINNKCYGFAYDDAANMAAYTAHENPKYLVLAIGF